MLHALRQWLRNSPHIHVHEQPVEDLRSCVALIDRFLDGKLRYPLEWDDFISWPHETPGIEAIRDTIAATEPLICSEDPVKRREGLTILFAERNRVAALAGISVRDGSAGGK